MPANNAARLLNELEQARSQIGTMKEREIARLLSATARASFGKDAPSLIRFHDLLMFLRAFPPGQSILRLAEQLLEKFEPQVKAVLAAGAAADDFAPEEVAGIAGTAVEATFSYPMVCWLVKHYQDEISIQWEGYERDPQRGLIWPRFFPLLEEDSLIEANVPYLNWLEAARGRQDELTWLIRQFQRLPMSEKEKAALYDSLEIMVRWDMSGSRASRTLSRKPVQEFYFHRAPLIQRRQVSFADELVKPLLRVTALSLQQAQKALDVMKQTLGVRYRELYGTSNATAEWVVQSNVGRGTEIYICGLPPERRLPLRAYLAGLTVKNGVPINYFECSSLFEWTEIGFNTFPAYRDGETAWLYAQTLRLLNQLHGTRAVSVYPYQIGDDNEEAIVSGAFWFYRKMGFRSMNPELEKLAQAEEKKVLAKEGYRTPAGTLRRLSKANVVYELPDAQAGAWDKFSVRNVGLAVQRRMARDFGGDAEAMRKAAVDRLARMINVNLQKLKPQALGAFSDFAMVLSLVPALSRWSSDDKDALREIIAAKAGRNELRYLRLLQSHARLRAAILRLGSQKR
ncbi:MAG TPA: hypothetical protein VGQ12_15695 [Candidatus Angelobacter sp.]|jgi:hypothetical protein|nr:hypothetical protein [Candidatus Angelobacter sp.]